MKKRIISSSLVVAFVLSTLIMPSFLFQDPLKCSSLTGCGDWSQCPDRVGRGKVKYTPFGKQKYIRDSMRRKRFQTSFLIFFIL
ncbi:MAG: hypothetical protein GF368_01760 [Candidatus Aenigmarchaeota archaeon]|nr:hypothetical protein [Candidatus Aenigmarchaeota archaeon]